MSCFFPAIPVAPVAESTSTSACFPLRVMYTVLIVDSVVYRTHSTSHTHHPNVSVMRNVRYNTLDIVLTATAARSSPHAHLVGPRFVASSPSCPAIVADLPGRCRHGNTVPIPPTPVYPVPFAPFAGPSGGVSGEVSKPKIDAKRGHFAKHPRGNFRGRLRHTRGGGGGIGERGGRRAAPPRTCLGVREAPFTPFAGPSGGVSGEVFKDLRDDSVGAGRELGARRAARSAAARVFVAFQATRYRPPTPPFADSRRPRQPHLPVQAGGVSRAVFEAKNRPIFSNIRAGGLAGVRDGLAGERDGLEGVCDGLAG
ncbi:hypothetical protein BD626DRAFT_576705 [Schizophyllum amplum]|uniref:Uncharacterized protein n=1 Tax=Schizophyllum amplum TaxID=97359 RepID=A0A550BT77_9AGAR|nr:hypothetical protein BD626DRAFT_576705 [Auriculariopsis ampla]